MKRTTILKAVILIFAVSFSFRLDAQEKESKWSVSGMAGLYSCYPFAGVMYGGVSFYPYVELGYSLSDDFSLCAAVAAITDFNAKLFLPGSVKENFSCFEYDLGFRWKGLSVFFDDMVDSFRLGDKSAHYLGIFANWTLNEKYPLTAMLYTVLSAPMDFNSKGKPAYSTVVNLSYPFSIGKHISLGPEIAIVPWNSPFCGYDTFSLCQLGATGSYSFSFGDSCALPLSLNAGWNPVLKNFYWYSSIILAFE